MSFIFFFLFIIFLVIAIILSIGASFFKILFGRAKYDTKQNQRKQQYDQSRNSHSESSGHQKVFKKDEGEYIDYEEVE